MTDLEKIVIDIFKNYNKDINYSNLDDNFEQFNIDSLDMVEILARLEDEFNIEIDDDEFSNKCFSIKTTINYIVNLIDIDKEI